MNKVIHQRLKGIIQKARDFGCYFIVIINMWCRVAEIETTPKIINQVYKKAFKNNLITKNCYMYYGASEGISRILNRIFDKNIIVVYVGRFKNGVYTYDNPNKTKYSNLVGRHDKGDKNNSHFIEVYPDGSCRTNTWPELGHNKTNLRGSRLFNIIEQ